MYKDANGTKYFYDCPHHYKVMAVAVIGTDGFWMVFIRDVPGQKHDEEWYEVARTGAKLDYETAKLWFPQLAEWAEQKKLRYGEPIF